MIMTLERRRSARQPVDFEVVMRYRQRRFPPARARDLSPEGIYVQTSKLTLPTGTLIEIELDRWGRQWLIPATVVYGDTNGFRLMFHASQSELYRYETATLTATRLPVCGREITAIPS
jgi:hypothetical protein